MAQRNMDGGGRTRAQAGAEVLPVAPQDSAEQEPTFQDLLEERLSTLGLPPYSLEKMEALRQMPEFNLIWPITEAHQDTAAPKPTEPATVALTGHLRAGGARSGSSAER